MMGGVLRWAVQNAPADLCRKVGLFANQSCAQNPEKRPAFLKIMKRLNLQPLTFMKQSFLKRKRRPVRVRRKTFLKIVVRILAAPDVHEADVLGVVERAVNVGQVPLPDALAGEEVLTQKPALPRPSHAVTTCAPY